MGGVKQHVFSLSALRSKMGRYRRKRVHSNDKHLKKKYRTRRRTKDLDEIEVDLLTDGANIQRSDPDLPGSGQHYCIHCARYFIDDTALKSHFTTKLHKRRMKALSEPVYTQKEADMAAGMGCYTLPPAPLELTSSSSTAAVCMEEMASLSVNDNDK